MAELGSVTSWAEYKGEEGTKGRTVSIVPLL